jgi:ABC-2 type transport system permease protein
MSKANITLYSLLRREINRFMKIKRQTLGGPLLETFLYISVFGAALGSRIHTIQGYKYIVFVIPGLIMMAWAVNAFSNNSSSILQQKFQHSIDDQLSSPASPLQLLLGFTLGGFVRGFIVASLTFIVSVILVSLPVVEPLVLIPSLILVGLFFSQCGVLVGVRAEQFDDVALYQTFVLQPLIFLGGVFYTAPSALEHAHALQPDLLHDRADPIWVSRIQGRERRVLVRVPGRGHGGAVRVELPDLRDRALPPHLVS